MPSPYVRVTLDMEPDLHEKMRREAASFGLSVSEAIRARLRAPMDPRTREQSLKRRRRPTNDETKR